MPNKKKITNKRYVDLSTSSRSKLNMYEKILEDKLKVYTPASVLKMLKYVCEERNAAVQKTDKEDLAKWYIRDSYYQRNVIADMKGFMRTIKRNLGGTLADEYNECTLYYKGQRAFFAGLKRYSKRSRSPLQEPGKTAYNMAGRYYGIDWLISCFDAAMSFNNSTSAKILWSYWWWFLSICRGWYVGERLAVCIKNITVGRQSVDWVVKEYMNSTFIKIDEVRRKKTNLQAYGNLYCTHQEKTTWQYEDCPESGCILHILVIIAQRIVNDLLAIALRNTKLVEPPITLDTRRATSYWQKQISKYLLFVMQKTHFLDLLPEKKDNILYQCGYTLSGISLGSLLQTNEKHALTSLPYWIVLKRMTAQQLQRFCRSSGIEIPNKCTLTRDSLYSIVKRKYDEWDKVLNDRSTGLPDLLTVFGSLDDCNDICEAKAFCRNKIKLMIPGDEILVMWLTANKKGFCPIIKKTPGAHTHKVIITSWLHSLCLLHEETTKDPRSTRVFSDTDSRTHCLHLRRDSGENTLDLCLQLGWKPPPVLSDTGNSVYRRSHAIVTHPEYNYKLMSYLQLVYEGKIEKFAGFDWSSMVAGLRLNWLQMKKLEIDKRVNDQIRAKIKEQLFETTIKDLGATVLEIEKKLSDMADFISSAVIVSMQSADDVGQTILSKFKKRKKKDK